MSLLISLFITFLLIGATSFGGGYAVMPLIQHYIVENQAWITMNELADITSISQMTPGPIFINAATFVGIKVAGHVGGLIATIASVLPSFGLVLILGYLFTQHGQLYFFQNIMKGLRPAIIGLIWVAAITLFSTALFDVDPGRFSIEWPAALAFIAGLIISMKTKWDTFVIVICGAGIGLLFYYLPF